LAARRAGGGGLIEQFCQLGHFHRWWHQVDLESWRGCLNYRVYGLDTAVSCDRSRHHGGSLALVAAFCAAWHGTRLFVLMERLLAPLLSVRMSRWLGIAFLLAPSGWILRSLSPWATGFTRPPDWLIVQDSRV
jgi:ABC-type uncharacterized transport system YnjBCD permease subunit